VKDAELEKVAAEILDRESPRSWYNALMDYGAEIKRTREPFARHQAMRCRRLRQFLQAGARGDAQVPAGAWPSSLDDMRTVLPFSMESLEKGAAALASEGFAEYCKAEYCKAENCAAETGSRGGSRLRLRA